MGFSTMDSYKIFVEFEKISWYNALTYHPSRWSTGVLFQTPLWIVRSLERHREYQKQRGVNPKLF